MARPSWISAIVTRIAELGITATCSCVVQLLQRAENLAELQRLRPSSTRTQLAHVTTYGGCPNGQNSYGWRGDRRRLHVGAEPGQPVARTRCGRETSGRAVAT